MNRQVVPMNGLTKEVFYIHSYKRFLVGQYFPNIIFYYLGLKQ